jgi:hypothetical protein
VSIKDRLIYAGEEWMLYAGAGVAISAAGLGATLYRRRARRSPADPHGDGPETV